LMTRSRFVVGRRYPRSIVLVVTRAEPTPIVGPWTLTALVSAN
jgi:hypothetical protein